MMKKDKNFHSYEYSIVKINKILYSETINQIGFTAFEAELRGWLVLLIRLTKDTFKEEWMVPIYCNPKLGYLRCVLRPWKGYYKKSALPKAESWLIASLYKISYYSILKLFHIKKDLNFICAVIHPNEKMGVSCPFLCPLNWDEIGSWGKMNIDEGAGSNMYPSTEKDTKDILSFILELSSNLFEMLALPKDYEDYREKYKFNERLNYLQR